MEETLELLNAFSIDKGMLKHIRRTSLRLAENVRPDLAACWSYFLKLTVIRGFMATPSVAPSNVIFMAERDAKEKVGPRGHFLSLDELFAIEYELVAFPLAYAGFVQSAGFGGIAPEVAKPFFSFVPVDDAVGSAEASGSAAGNAGNL